MLLQVDACAKSSSWMEYTSENFLVYSDRKPREAQRLIEGFEQFRSAALALTGLTDRSESRPVQIFIFEDQRDYRSIQPDKSIAGFFLDGWPGPRMTVGAHAKLEDASLVLFHEYVHYLIREHGQSRYPLWYEEGFADLLASAKLEHNKVVIGSVHPWRQPWVDDDSLLSIKELLQPAMDSGDKEYWAQYYATAWLFSHYLQLGPLVDEPAYSDITRAYIAAEPEAQSRESLFKQHYGISTDAMDRALRSYRDKPLLAGYQIDVPAYRGSIRKRHLGLNETAYLLGDLAYRSGQHDGALEFLSRVEAAKPSVARALALRAVIESYSERHDLALHFLALALKHDHDDPEVLTNAAHVHWARAPRTKQTDPTVGVKRALHKVVEFAEEALLRDSGNTEAMRFLARAQRLLGRESQAIRTWQRAYRIRPSDIDLNFEIGAMLALSSEPQRARPFLSRVLLWHHSVQRRQQARDVLNSLSGPRATLVAELEVDMHDTPLQLVPRQRAP